MTNSFFVECLIGDDDWIPTTFDDLLFENPPLQQDDVNEGAGGPAINDWEEAPCAIPTITIDKARREAWNQGKRECAAIREKLKRLLVFKKSIGQVTGPAISDIKGKIYSS